MSDFGKRLRGDWENAELIARAGTLLNALRDSKFHAARGVECAKCPYCDDVLRILESPAPLSEPMTPNEARGLAAGLLDFAEGRVKSLDEIRSGLADAADRKTVGSFSAGVANIRQSVPLSEPTGLTQGHIGPMETLVTFIGCIQDLEDAEFTQEELDELRRLAGLSGAAPLSEEAPTLCPTCESMNHEVRQTCLIPERGKWTGIKHSLRYICADPWHESVVFSEEAPTPTDQRMPTDQEEVAAQEFFTTRGSFGAAMVSWEIACRMAALYGLWVKRGAAFSEEAARREFEEWAKIHYPSADLVSDTDGYWNTLVRCSWEGWLACAKKRAEG